MYYFYGKSNRGHGICPLYRGCPPLGESSIRGFTVYLFDSTCHYNNSQHTGSSSNHVIAASLGVGITKTS